MCNITAGSVAYLAHGQRGKYIILNFIMSLLWDYQHSIFETEVTSIRSLH